MSDATMAGAPSKAEARSDAADGVILRRLEAPGEYAACVRLQEEVWGDGFTERVPATILQIAQRVGGVTAGAFDQSGQLLGFVFGLTGIRDGHLVHWSDMLAVHPTARNQGLGVRLKIYQRELVRSLGVETMLWTFDPLVARNAHLNLNRLGARAVEYIQDMYGAGTGSTLHGALSTDRLMVVWDLTATPGGEAPSADGAADGASAAAAPVVNAEHADASRPPTDEFAEVPTVRIEVPADFYAVLASTPEGAQWWRESTRRAFLWYLGRGYRIAGFRHDRATGRTFYWLTSA